MSRVAKLAPSGVHAVFACDPGGTSGVAAGYVELRKTLKETLTEKGGVMRRKAVEVEGDWLTQAGEIANLMNRFQFTANSEWSMALTAIHFVFEDFVLRMPATTTTLTSIWVMAGAVARYRSALGDLRAKHPSIDYYQASQAKSFATNERLKLWKLWEVGSEHKRDAWRLFALHVNRLVGV